MKNGRCWMHGGASLRPWWAPRYSHGRYSQAAKDEAAARRERKARRIKRALRRKLLDWWAEHSEAGAASLLRASRRIRREHVESLARRRDAYRLRKVRLPFEVV